MPGPSIAVAHPAPQASTGAAGPDMTAAPRAGSPFPPATRRVLMLSAAFPPTGGPGVQRSAKFAKYLPEFGWQPVVVAAERVPGLPRDDSLLGDLPADLVVHRRPLRDRGETARGVIDAGANGSAGVTARHWREGLAWRVERLRRRFVAGLPPDPLIGWALRAYPACRTLIEHQGIDAIYSTYSPPSNHVLGWLLHRATGRPWVADFRDLWTADYAYPHRGLRRWFDRWLERRVLEAADAVIGVTPSQTALLALGSRVRRERFVTITNGIDADDFASLDRAAVRRALHGPEDRFVLAFTGWFLSDRVSDEVIGGLARFTAGRRERFELRIVGAISVAMHRRLEDAGVPVWASGYVPHARAIEHMVAADVLFLPVPQGPNGHTLLPGKLFEYLAASRPILAVGATARSEAARLIDACAAGVCVEANAADVSEALTRLWNQWEARSLPGGCAPERLAPLSRRHLTGTLGQVLDRICDVAVARSRRVAQVL